MTQTIQPCSCAYINETEKTLKINKPQTEDNMSLLLQVFDSLNKLYNTLNRLNYVIQRKNMEQIAYQTGLQNEN
jgi:DNA-binding phage protein